MSAITTHILDTSTGRPASGVSVALEQETTESGWQIVAKGLTDDDGRLRLMQETDELFMLGHYRLSFDTGVYFAAAGVESFYPQISVTFTVRDPAAHYHVPLLVSPFGYSTYRGS
jgi:5-hydroxyisourate hydrolase